MRGGGGQRPLGIFPKIHPVWHRHPALIDNTKQVHHCRSHLSSPAFSLHICPRVNDVKCWMQDFKCWIWNPKSKIQKKAKCKIQNAVFWAKSNSFLPPTHVKVGAQQRLSLETEFTVIWKTRTEDFKKISNFDWWQWRLRWWNVYKLCDKLLRSIFCIKIRHQKYSLSGKAFCWLAGLSCFQ